jgi:hypothetical protein
MMLLRVEVRDEMKEGKDREQFSSTARGVYVSLLHPHGQTSSNGRTRGKEYIENRVLGHLTSRPKSR